MAIFVTGDTHGGGSHIGSPDGYLHRLSVRNFPKQRDLTKNDFVVILGDFGGVWDVNRYEVKESDAEKYELDWLESKPFTTLFIPGNHENYHRLVGCSDTRLLNSWFYANMSYSEKKKLKAGYPRSFWKGGYVRKIRPSVIMLERGYVFDIDGANCFAFGGAASHDISGGILHPADYRNKEEFCAALNTKQRQSNGFYRVAGVSWWEEEVPSDIEKCRAHQSLIGCPNVDFVFTHEAPRYSKIVMGYTPDELSNYLETLRPYMKHNAKWFFGHLHRDGTPLTGHHAFYTQISQIH